MKNYGFVYIWLDRKYQRYYIGCRWGHETDGYVCSSNWMKRAYKARPSDFKRRIVARVHTTRTDLLDEEYRWLQMIKPNELKQRYYNLHNHHFGHWSTNPITRLTMSEKISKGRNSAWEADPTIKERMIASMLITMAKPEVREKISQRTKERMTDPVVRKRYEDGLAKRDNRSSDPVVIEKRRQGMIATMAKKFPVEDRKTRPTRESAEHSANMARNTKALWEQPGYRERVGAAISASLTGKVRKRGHKQSDEWVAKRMEKLRGRPFIESHVAALSAGQTGKVWWNNGTERTRALKCPGEGWLRGKSINKLSEVCI